MYPKQKQTIMRLKVFLFSFISSLLISDTTFAQSDNFLTGGGTVSAAFKGLNTGLETTAGYGFKEGLFSVGLGLNPSIYRDLDSYYYDEEVRFYMPVYSDFRINIKEWMATYVQVGQTLNFGEDQKHGMYWAAGIGFSVMGHARLSPYISLKVANLKAAGYDDVGRTKTISTITPILTAGIRFK